MIRCQQEGCQGHLGKYESCLDEALHLLVSNNTPGGDTVGSMDRGWVTDYIHIAETGPLPTGWTGNGAVDGWAIVEAGWYSVTEDDRGFVSSVPFGSEADWQAALDHDRADHEQWEATA